MKSSSRSTAKPPEGSTAQRLWLLGAGAEPTAQRLVHDAGWPRSAYAAGPVHTAESAAEFGVLWQGLPPEERTGWRLVLLATDAAATCGLPQEQALRQTLSDLGLAHQVVYPQQGSHDQALRLLLGLVQRRPMPGRLSAACEKCSDPDCEHRLFQDLLARRGAPPHCT